MDFFKCTKKAGFNPNKLKKNTKQKQQQQNTSTPHAKGNNKKNIKEKNILSSYILYDAPQPCPDLWNRTAIK